MNEDINELFGDLRSMLSSRNYEPRELYWLLDEAYENDPQHYQDQWFAYLSAYSPLSMTITSADELDKLEQLLPPDTQQDVCLRMTRHHLRKWHFEQIADSEGAWFLCELDISYNQAQNHYPAAFAHTDTMLNLRTLNMAYCDLHNLVAVWVLRAPFLTHVEDLNLAGNPLELNDVRTFASNEHIERITRLVMHSCGLDFSKLEALLGAPFLQQLEHLDLSDNPFNADCFKMLAGWESCQYLKSLELPWSKVDNATRQLLLASPNFPEQIRDYIFEKTLPKNALKPK